MYQTWAPLAGVPCGALSSSKFQRWLRFYKDQPDPVRARASLPLVAACFDASPRSAQLARAALLVPPIPVQGLARRAAVPNMAFSTLYATGIATAHWAVYDGTSAVA